MKRTHENPSVYLDKKKLIEEGYEYAWIMTIGAVVLKRVLDIDLPAPDELLEARIFSENKELHFFRCEEELCCVCTVTEETDTANTSYTEETQKLRKRFGRTITLRRFIDHDEDGMAYFSACVLCKADLGGRA